MSVSKDQRGRIAVDIMTKNLKTHAEKNGVQLTDSQARKKAQEIAERANRKREK